MCVTTNPVLVCALRSPTHFIKWFIPWESNRRYGWAKGAEAPNVFITMSCAHQDWVFMRIKIISIKSALKQQNAAASGIFNLL